MGLAPDSDQPGMHYNIRGERYTSELGPGGRTDIRLTHYPRARNQQVNEAGP
ncbi:hypothetical protein GCM10007857_67750 [Bradyrhizobium iriomotense]|uniref:Uncharacterized protein n=1 Tax=Bradyrhizobium iriomotense TaxID=441950 RepID=A0ABQ6B997_9BRAD|nr:hypothetical protein GCM10007857_67750 [Bradyrhizobium iriomotense]